MPKLYFGLHGQVSDWKMSTADNVRVYVFSTWDVDNFKQAQYRPGTALMHPAMSSATPRSYCIHGPSAYSSETGALEASCSRCCQTE